MKTTVPELFYVVLGIYAIFLPGTLACLILRRNKFPLSGRVLWLMIPIWITFAGYGVFQLIDALVDTNCVSVLVFESLVIFPGTLAELIRLIRLWVFYYAAEEMLQIRDAKSRALLDASTEVPTPWFTAKKKYFRLEYAGVFYAATVTFVSLITVSVFTFSPPNPDFYLFVRFPGCDTMPATMMVSQLLLSIGVVGVLITAWKIRNVSDGYFIVSELKLSALASVVVLAGRLYSDAYPVEPGTFAGQNLLASLSCLLGTWTFLAFAIFKGFFRDRNGVKHAAEERSSSWVDNRKVFYKLSMNTVLTDPAFAVEKRSFLFHLKKEFAVDQILFYEAATCFAEQASTFDEKTLCWKAMEVYDTFIRRGTDQEANISSPIRTEIDAQLRTHVSDFDGSQRRSSDATSRRCCGLVSSSGASSYTPVPGSGNISPQVFDNAKRDVYRLLNLGTFARWQANYIQEVSVSAVKSPHSKESLGLSEKLDLELDLESSIALNNEADKIPETDENLARVDREVSTV